MEPFNPIPGKPPRKVVIDRQRKLFASLEIEELLVELVSAKTSICRVDQISNNDSNFKLTVTVLI
jgi:hypothetical protein